MAGSEQRNSVVIVFMGRNGMHGRVHREGLDRRGDGNKAWCTAERRKRTSYSRNGGPVDREGCGVPQNGGNGLVLERYGRNGSPVHGHLFNHPSTGYCSSSSPPSTVHPALHGVVLFILPSTGSCSSSPNRLGRLGS